MRPGLSNIPAVIDYMSRMFPGDLVAGVRQVQVQVQAPRRPAKPRSKQVQAAAFRIKMIAVWNKRWRKSPAYGRRGLQAKRERDEMIEEAYRDGLRDAGLAEAFEMSRGGIRKMLVKRGTIKPGGEP